MKRLMIFVLIIALSAMNVYAVTCGQGTEVSDCADLEFDIETCEQSYVDMGGGSYMYCGDNGGVCDIYGGCDEECGASTICMFASLCTDVDDDNYCAESAASGCINTGICETGWDDCNDGDNQIYPGNADVCDGKDNDCNGGTADGSGESAPLNDNQNGVCAGSTKSCTGSWVNDYSGVANYEATEVSCDTLDNDCDTSTDEGLTTTYYQDSDTDTYGNPAVNQEACTQPGGYVSNSGDCDDTVFACNTDCASLKYQDSDTDGYGNAAVSARACDAPGGYVSDNTDCDDTEINNFQLNTGYMDTDYDGYANEKPGAVDGVIDTNDKYTDVCSGAPSAYSNPGKINDGWDYFVQNPPFILDVHEPEIPSTPDQFDGDGPLGPSEVIPEFSTLGMILALLIVFIGTVFVVRKKPQPKKVLSTKKK